ncbi:hypothetical protein [Nocardioides sp. NPDC006303]|uniref:hypothetical protein n=1 Tax=Nocardioides sp. NPDC006303 TaxID=3156747 RepID=UPI0033BA6640
MEQLIEFAAEIRIGSRIDSAALAALRGEIELASHRWRANGGVLRGATVGALPSLYPAMLGATGPYGEKERRAIEDLADDLLEGLLAAVGVG